MNSPTGRDTHRQAAPEHVSAAVLTISDTRTPETDTGGAYLETELKNAGHTILGRAIVKDDSAAIRAQLEAWLAQEVQVIITTGGTGIAKRDNTIPVVESLAEKNLPGFGEIFRMLSYKEVGAAAILSRATAVMSKKSLVFALPGSLNAVQTAWQGILRDELSHLVWEILR